MKTTLEQSSMRLEPSQETADLIAAMVAKRAERDEAAARLSKLESDLAQAKELIRASLSTDGDANEAATVFAHNEALRSILGSQVQRCKSALCQVEGQLDACRRNAACALARECGQHRDGDKSKDGNAFWNDWSRALLGLASGIDGPDYPLIDQLLRWSDALKQGSARR